MTYIIRSNRTKHGSTEMTLLPSFYPSEMDVRRALSRFQKANPGLKAWLVQSSEEVKM